MSDAVKMATSSVVASDAEITAAWFTSSVVIWIGLVLSELHAAAKTSAISGAPTKIERFIRNSLVGVERTRRRRGNATLGSFFLQPRFDPFDVREGALVT